MGCLRCLRNRAQKNLPSEERGFEEWFAAIYFLRRLPVNNARPRSAVSEVLGSGIAMDVWNGVPAFSQTGFVAPKFGTRFNSLGVGGGFAVENENCHSSSVTVLKKLAAALVEASKIRSPN